MTDPKRVEEPRPDRLPQIRERWEKATLGPWKSVRVGEGFPCVEHPHFDVYREVQPIHEIVNEPGRLEGRGDFSEPPNGVNVGCWLGSKPDAIAIAAAPEDVRWLVAEVERLRCQWAEMQGLCVAYAELLRMKKVSDAAWDRLKLIEEKYDLR
jgi:hypothetical protein